MDGDMKTAEKAKSAYEDLGIVITYETLVLKDK